MFYIKQLYTELNKSVYIFFYKIYVHLSKEAETFKQKRQDIITFKNHKCTNF